MSTLLVLIGLLTAIASPSQRRSITYLALAVTSLAWMGWWTLFGATLYTGPRPPGETGLRLWATTVLPGVGLSALELMVGAFGALGALRTSRRSGVALMCGAGLILIGTASSPASVSQLSYPPDCSALRDPTYQPLSDRLLRLAIPEGFSSNKVQVRPHE
jgi:hypothetical protein